LKPQQKDAARHRFATKIRPAFTNQARFFWRKGLRACVRHSKSAHDLLHSSVEKS
jgi:hypothetical protein